MKKQTPKTKEEARQYAIEWQNEFGKERAEYMTYSELSEWQSEFYDLAIKFDLLAEFKENGII